MTRKPSDGWSDYPDHFSSADDADTYDELFRSDRCEQVCWEIQRALLHAVVAGFSSPAETKGHALDFACGTGRVTEVLYEAGLRTVGLDASDSMVALAKRRMPAVEFRVGLLGTTETDQWLSALGSPFQLITAFRFFLNTPADQRAPILDLLVRQLHSQGRIIVNNHGSGPSLRNLGLKLRRNQDATILTQREFVAMLDSAGLDVEQRWGGQIFTRKLYSSPIIRHVTCAIERLLPRTAIGRALARAVGAQQTYLCQMASRHYA